MSKRLLVTPSVLLALVLGSACNRGYVSPEAMESGEIGPRYCAHTRSELGLEMGAFVLVQHSYAGCVCTPARTAGADVGGGVAANAGAVLAIGEAARQQQQQAAAQRR